MGLRFGIAKLRHNPIWVHKTKIERAKLLWTDSGKARRCAKGEQKEGGRAPRGKNCRTAGREPEREPWICRGDRREAEEKQQPSVYGGK